MGDFMSRLQDSRDRQTKLMGKNGRGNETNDRGSRQQRIIKLEFDMKVIHFDIHKQFILNIYKISFFTFL